jgi:hypothetical protein
MFVNEILNHAIKFRIGESVSKKDKEATDVCEEME